MGLVAIATLEGCQVGRPFFMTFIVWVRDVAARQGGVVPNDYETLRNQDGVCG